MKPTPILDKIEEFIYSIRRLSLKKIYRSIRFLIQRLTRGWDDSETWSLDQSAARLILPRLRRFKQLSIGYHEGSMTQEEWNLVLDKMIAFFEFASSEERWQATRADYDKHDEGLALFCKHYYNLWW